MSFSLKAGLASAALAVAIVAVPAVAADLGGQRGSIKDGGYQPMPVIQQGPAGPCYFRADVGYSRSRNPSVNFPVSSRTDTTDLATGNTTSTFAFVGENVSNTKLENSWLGEAGVGCGSGSYGFRGELMLGARGERKLEGEPAAYTVTAVTIGNPPVVTPQPADPLHTTLKTYTAMANVYKDLGNFGGFVPYLGAGVGAAYHQVGDVYFTGNPLLVNRIKGANDLAFAWSLMAGVGYQVSDRAILDFGYRYMDLGKAASGRVDNAGFVNPRVNITDITAHEFKVGLRYHFGGSDCCSQGPSLK